MPRPLSNSAAQAILPSQFLSAWLYTRMSLSWHEYSRMATALSDISLHSYISFKISDGSGGGRAKHKNTVLKQRLSNFCELLEVKESRISRVSTCNTLAGLELDEFKENKEMV